MSGEDRECRRAARAGEVWHPGFWWRHAVLPGLLFVAVTLPFELTDLDLRLTDPFYDFAAARWPYLDVWWAHDFLHTGGKFLIWGLGSVPALVFLSSWRVARCTPWRRTSLYLVLCLAIAPATVAILKVLTHRHCPWAMTRYGGDVPWTRLFDFGATMLSGGRPGRCFPAAHASSALGLFGLYFVSRALGHRRPWRWCLPAAVLGSAFAFAQHARGAHFFSHNLWAIAVCWGLALALYAAFGGRIGRQLAVAKGQPAATAVEASGATRAPG